MAAAMTPGTATRWLSAEHGSTLLETVLATAVLFVALGGLLGIAGIAVQTTENQGHFAARTTEYAQDKMEQLLSLTYIDAASDTGVFPIAAAGGTGLTVGGSADPANPVAGYVDYLDQSGNLLVIVGNAAPVGWFYERAWAIANPSANLKQITVTVIVARSVANAVRPRSTVTALKTSPF